MSYWLNEGSGPSHAEIFRLSARDPGFSNSTTPHRTAPSTEDNNVNLQQTYATFILIHILIL
jgi:hypothetical protein